MTNNSMFKAGDDPLQIQRTNVDSEYPMSVVRLHLSGFIDLLYVAKATSRVPTHEIRDNR